MDKNITSTSGKGKVHKLVRSDTYTHEVIGKDYGHPDYGIHAPWCDRSHNLKPSMAKYQDWYLPWKKTGEPITCKTCLQAYWPDGKKRFFLLPNRKEDGIRVTAKKTGDKVYIKTAIFDRGKSLGSSAVIISRPAADKLWSQLCKILNRKP